MFNFIFTKACSDILLAKMKIHVYFVFHSQLKFVVGILEGVLVHVLLRDDQYIAVFPGQSRGVEYRLALTVDDQIVDGPVRMKYGYPDSRAGRAAFIGRIQDDPGVDR